MKHWALVFVAIAFLLAPAARADDVHGTLLDAAGKPVAGADLNGSSRNSSGGREFYQAYRATTDAQGRFTLSLRVHASYPVPFLAHLTDGRVFEGSLTADNGTARLGATVIPLRIRAVDGQGHPLAGAFAEVTSISTKTPGESAFRSSRGYRPGEFRRVTGADGVARFEGVPPEAFVAVRVSSLGLLAPDFYVECPSSGEVSRDVVLKRAAVVSGHVFKDGKPVSGVSVVGLSMVGHDGHELRSQTADDGSYKFENVTPGTISVAVTANQATDGLVAVPISDLPVAEGAQVTNADLTLGPGIPLRVRVTAERSGKPIEGAVVRISVGMVDTEMKKTGPDGRIEVMVPPGHHYIAVDSIGDRRMGGRPYLHLDVTAAKNPQWDLKVPDALLFAPIPHLTGTVLDKTGKPVAGAKVRALMSGVEVTSGANGAFSFPGATQAGELVIAIKGDAMTLSAIEVSDKPVIKMRLDGKTAEIRGRVVGEDGRPLAGVEISLGGQRGNDFIGGLSTTTDAKGSYRFPGLYASIDSFFVWAKKSGFGGATIQPIKLDPGETKALADLKITPADGVIEGTVIGPDGSPMKGVRVSAQTDESEDVTTDEKGAFRLTHVPRGKHYVTVRRTGFDMAVIDASTGQKGIVVKLKPTIPKPGGGG